jgi:hypothetical protein
LVGFDAELELENAAVCAPSLIMFERAYQVQFIFRGIPVTTDSLKDSRAVLQRVRQYPDLSFRQRDKLIRVRLLWNDGQLAQNQ